MYNKKQWESNELITKEALNNIENGIAALDKTFDTVEDLKNADVKVGDIVNTLGYYKKGDGGGYVYEIVNDSTLDTEVVHVQLNNGLKAKYGLNLDLYDINVLTIGIKKHDRNAEERNSEIMEKTMVKFNRVCKLFFPGGEYFISNIHFTRDSSFTGIPEIVIYGEQAGRNETNKSGNKSKINTQHKDFISDERYKNDIVTSMVFYIDDINIISDSYIDKECPSGICFGQPEETPLKEQEVNFHLNNVDIIGFHYGCRSPHWACSASGGRRITFSNCHCGFYVGQAMHCFDADEISFNDCVLGMDTGWGGVNARIKNVHVSTGYLGPDRADFNEYTAILSRGGFTIDALYYEPYNNNGYMDRCVLIKHEGYAYGIGPLYIKNTNIGCPGSGNTGVFLKSDCYLGFGPSRGVENATRLSPWAQGHFPLGAVIFEHCSVPAYVSTLKNVVKINDEWYNATHDYKYKNIWWGYDFDGLELHTPEILIGHRPFLRGKGYLTPQPFEPIGVFKEINAAVLSEVSNMYSPEYFSDKFMRNQICGQFISRNSTDRFTYEYDISISIDGTFSENADVTIGLFARTGFDNSTLRLIKKIQVIKGNETYNDYEKYVHFELNPYIDFLDTENRIYFGIISNTGLADNALTLEDRELINFDYTVKSKMITGRKYS